MSTGEARRAATHCSVGAWRTLNALSATERSTLFLACRRKLTPDEISARLGVPIERVRLTMRSELIECATSIVEIDG